MATIQQRQYEPLPVGTYAAKIGAVGVEPGKFGGDQVKIRFDITQPGFEDRDVLGFASAVFTPASKLFGWTRAAFGGKEIPPTYNLNTDDLLDREVVLTLVQRAADDGRVFNRIDAVSPKVNGRPAPMAARAAAPAAAPAPAPAPAGNGGSGGVVRQGNAARPAPLTAASAAGVAPQRGPVTVGGSNQNEPPDWPEWEPEAVGADEGLPF
jgi:hypothetical protein